MKNLESQTKEFEFRSRCNKKPLDRILKRKKPDTMWVCKGPSESCVKAEGARVKSGRTAEKRWLCSR